MTPEEIPGFVKEVLSQLSEFRTWHGEVDFDLSVGEPPSIGSISASSENRVRFTVLKEATKK